MRIYSLEPTKYIGDYLVRAPIGLDTTYSFIAPDIENCNNQDKKDAYTYLDLAIKASNEGVDVKGYLDPSVLTTGHRDTLEEAKVLIEQWRREYNQVRPHSFLGYRPPAPDAIMSMVLT